MPEEKIVHKGFAPGEIKLAPNGEGTFRAVFATLNVVDKDGDIIAPGAVGEQKVLISQYNHGSWAGGGDAMPIGVGRVFEEGDNAIVEGEFDMSDAAAQKTYEKFKYLQEKGYEQEFSFALPDMDWQYAEEGGKRVRKITRVKIPEVSPVLMGAGVDTRLLDVKSVNGERFADQAERVLGDVQDLVKRYHDIAEMRAEKGKDVSPQNKERVQAVMAELVKLAESEAEEAEEEEVEEEEDYDAAAELLLYQTLNTGAYNGSE